MSAGRWPSLPVRPDAAPSAESRRTAIDRLLAWARAAGASWDGIAVHVDEAGHATVRATRPLATGDVILNVPRHAMIIDDEIAAGGGDPRDTLAAWLALEVRDTTSPWRAYLDTLPVQLPELPMFHADHEPLAGTLASALGAEHARGVIDSYARLDPALRMRISLADFAWGCAIVMSRGYHAPGTFEHHIALIPLVDLFDHRLGDTTWVYDPRDALFTVSTERAFAAGEAVHFPYGDRSNSHLLVHFGFTEADNAASEAGLWFGDATAPVVVGATFDGRLWDALTGARELAVLATAAEHALAALATRSTYAEVRAGERRVLEAILAFARGEPGALQRDYQRMLADG